MSPTASSRPSLTEGPIARTLLMFSLPILGANVLQSLNASVNMVWIGHYLGESALTASNRRFHDTLYRCSHNRYLLNMVTVLHDALSLLGRTTLSHAQRAEQTLSEHRAVVAAIRVRDADAAEQALRAHIRTAHKVRMQNLFAAAP